MATNRSGSILAVDFGNVHTRAVLIDLVEGAYRTIASGEVRTTGGFPHGDVGIGMARALRQITRATGRRLVSNEGGVITPEDSEGAGIDTLLITTSIGRPLRTVLLGLTAEMSIASALRAVAGTYVQVVETITLEDARAENEQLNAIVLSRPDLLFIVGGTDGGARETLLRLAKRAALALYLTRGEGRQRLVLYAGNRDVAPEIEKMFASTAKVLIADNVRPSAEREYPAAAAAQLAFAYDQISAERGVGFEAAATGSALGVLPTAQSYNLVARYLARVSTSALALDVGSGGATLAAAIGERSTTTIRSDIGLGQSARALLEAVGTEAVRRWLPYVVDDNELAAYALNKMLRPGTVPENLRELYLEHAFLRAGVKALLQTARPLWTQETRIDPDAPLPPFQTIVGSGAVFSGIGRPALAGMLLLDALQPTGVSNLLLDNNALIPALGALARVQQAAFVQLLDAGGIMALGTCISIDGEARGKRATLRIRLTLPDNTIIKHDVPGGTLWVYPLPLGVRARLDVRALGGARIGGKRRVRMEVTGGTAGIIFDARGRPLPIGRTPAERAQQLPDWYAQATGDPVRAIQADWLQAVQKTAQPEPGVRESLAPRRERKPAQAKNEQVRKAEASRVRGRFKEQPADAQKQPEVPAPAKKDEFDDLRNLFS
jgi:hypothetical protein